MEEKTKMVLGRKNYIFIIIGCVVVLLGFVLMSGGGSEDPNVFNEDELFSFRRITLAPFLVMSREIYSWLLGKLHILFCP